MHLTPDWTVPRVEDGPARCASGRTVQVDETGAVWTATAGRAHTGLAFGVMAASRPTAFDVEVAQERLPRQVNPRGCGVEARPPQPDRFADHTARQPGHAEADYDSGD